MFDYQIITRTMFVTVGKKFYDPEVTEETLRASVESDLAKLYRDVRVDLVEGPEPHVLTVAEINKLPTGESESIPVVMEEKYPFQKWDGGSICKWVGSRFAVSQYRESLEEVPYEWYTYGKTMRFWSGMPTEEQKRGTAWNG